MNVLSLFAGIGGLELGLERAGMTTVGQVEIDPFCQRVLAKHWPEVPRHDDVRTAVEWWQSDDRPPIDLVCGGFPCQDISGAGRRAGIIDGERSSLWTYFARTVRVLRPRYVVVENVAALLVRGLDVVAGDLAAIGYDLRWDCLPAAAFGAPHRRDRWFGIAYPHGGQLRLEPVPEFGGQRPAVPDPDGAARHMADADCQAWTTTWRPGQAVPGPGAIQRPGRRSSGPRGHWAAEPSVGRVAHGVPDRMDRLRVLGNAVVPAVAEHIGRLIVAAESGEVAA